MLAVGDGGLVSHFTGPDDANRPEVQSFPAEQREQWLRAMRPIEPINFVGKAAPAALLFQAATMDEAVPREDTLRYYRAVQVTPRSFAGMRLAISSTVPPAGT